MLEYIRHLEELQIISTIRENCTPSIPNSGGGIENFKNLEGASKIYQ